MVFNHSIFYWQSWCHALSILLSYWSFNYIKRHPSRHHPFIYYMTVGIVWGGILWTFVAIKFNLSLNVFLQEWGYLIIFEILLYSYIGMLIRESKLRGHLLDFANHDALTKTQNYAAYTSEIEKIFDDNLNNNLDLSMMMFDIDHFKQINDTYGHLAGDKVLKAVAKTTQEIINDNDPQVKLFRTGGEEFNIIFPNYDLQSTESIVNKIFEALNNLTVESNKKNIKITVSVGVSAISKKDETPNEFYDRVDKNLYHSKENGRKQITAE